MDSARKKLTPADHQDKDVRKALKQILRRNGPKFELYAAGHWGTLFCDKGCCQIQVDGTPRVAHRHAKDLIREANKCPRKDGDIRKRPRRPRKGKASAN